MDTATPAEVESPRHNAERHSGNAERFGFFGGQVARAGVNAALAGSHVAAQLAHDASEVAASESVRSRRPARTVHMAHAPCTPKCARILCLLAHVAAASPVAQLVGS